MIWLFLGPRHAFPSTDVALQQCAAALAAHTGGEGKRTGKDEAGKPLWEGGYVSVSHARDLLAIAFSNHPVGVDVEWEQARDFRALSARLGSPVPDLEAFYRRWTAAECAFKATGMGVTEAFCAPPKTMRYLPWATGYCLGVLGRGRIQRMELPQRNEEEKKDMG